MSKDPTVGAGFLFNAVEGGLKRLDAVLRDGVPPSSTRGPIPPGATVYVPPPPKPLEPLPVRFVEEFAKMEHEWHVCRDTRAAVLAVAAATTKEERKNRKRKHKAVAKEFNAMRCDGEDGLTERATLDTASYVIGNIEAFMHCHRGNWDLTAVQDRADLAIADFRLAVAQTKMKPDHSGTK